MKSCLMSSCLLVLFASSCIERNANTNYCRLMVDSSFLRKNFKNLKEVKNTFIDSLIIVYKNQSIQHLIDSNSSESFDDDNASLFELTVPGFQKPLWHFFIRQEKFDTFFVTRMYLITGSKPTINDIFDLTYVTNFNVFSYKRSACFSDTAVIITHIDKPNYDLIIDETLKYQIDSFVYSYKIYNNQLVLMEKKL